MQNSTSLSSGNLSNSDKCLIVIIYSSLSLYLFSNFIVYFLYFCCFVGDWELKGQLEYFSGAKQEKFSKQDF